MITELRREDPLEAEVGGDPMRRASGNSSAQALLKGVAAEDQVCRSIFLHSHKIYGVYKMELELP